MGGELMLLIPALFCAICVTFIVVQTCYQKWKASSVWKKKREAAKISLINILQISNPMTFPPQWIPLGKEKDSKASPSPGEVADEKLSSETKASFNYQKLLEDPNFDPRRPNILSSVVTMRDDNDTPPPYEQLYEFVPPPPTPPIGESLKVTSAVTNMLLVDNRYGGNNEVCLLQVPSLSPTQDQKNSSAILYL